MAEQTKTVELRLHVQVISVVMRRHHWSKRLSLSLTSTGQVRLSVPPRTPWYIAEQFLVQSGPWIEQQLAKRPISPRRQPTAAERRLARTLVETKLAQWQSSFRLAPTGLRIANQSSRWGSASSRGTLSFNWRVIELREDLVDYLIVHELAHLEEANHSPAFWATVARALPDYKDRRRRLKAFALHD